MAERHGQAGLLGRFAGLLISFPVGLAATAALADRHCYPAQDAYYDMRYHLLAEGVACEIQIDEASDALNSALRTSEICGCAALIDHVRDLLAVREDATRNCQDRRQALLDAQAATKAAVSSCH